MEYFKEGGNIYNWEHSKGESVSAFLCIAIKTLDDGGFQFYQNALIRKFLEATGIDHCNGLPTQTKFEAPLGTDANSSEAKRDWTNSYAYVIGMMSYLASNTITYIYLTVHQWAQFTYNTKASHEIDAEGICRYLQGTKDNGLVFNPSKQLVVGFYADADFAGMWAHENPQDPIFDRSRTGFVVTFANFPLLWMSKIQADIDISTLYYHYLA